MTSELRVAWLVAFLILGVLLYLLAPVLTPFIAAALPAFSREWRSPALSRCF